MVFLLQVIIQGPGSFHLVALPSQTCGFQGGIKLEEGERKGAEARLFLNHLGLKMTHVVSDRHSISKNE